MKEHLHGNQTIPKLDILTGTGENQTMLGEVKIVLSFEKLCSHTNGVIATAMENIHYLLQTLRYVKSFNEIKI